MSTTSLSLWLLVMAMVGALIVGIITISNCSILYDSVDRFAGRSDAEKNYDLMEWRYAHSAASQYVLPEWSKDGSHIVFERIWSFKGRGPDDGFYVVASDGSRLWSMPAKRAYWPSLSPDGSSIAYSITPSQYMLPFYIETSRSDGSNRKRLTESRLNDASPSWSPDGKRIAFSRFTPAHTGDRGIYVMNADGSDLSWVYRFRSSIDGNDEVTEIHRIGPKWSPDGKTLAFVVVEYQESVGTRYVLYTIGADGSNLIRMFETVRQNVYYGHYPGLIDTILGAPAWSPDGRKLGFIRSILLDYRDFPEGDEIDAPPGLTVYTIDADGSNLRAVSELGDGPYPLGLSWSPDGTDILFTFHSGGDGYAVSANNSDYRELGKGGSSSSWSPDGSRIAVMTTLDPESPRSDYLYTVAPDGSDVRTLVVSDDDGDLKAAR